MGTKCTYVVARYRPAGNYEERFRDNVQQGSFSEKSCGKLDSSIQQESPKDVKTGDPERHSNLRQKEDDSQKEAAIIDEEDENGQTITKQRSINTKIKTADTKSSYIDEARQMVDNQAESLGKSDFPSMALELAEATALGAKIGALAGATAGTEAAQQAAAKYFQIKGHKREQRLALKHRKISSGVSVIPDDTLTNRTSSIIPRNITDDVIYTNTPNLFRKYSANNGMSFYVKLKKDVPVIRHDSKINTLRPLNVSVRNSSVHLKTGVVANINAKQKTSNINFSNEDVFDNQQLKREDSSTGFEQNGLKAHNMFRQIHDAPSMELDNGMSSSAADYAKKLVQLGKLEHSKAEERDNNGENLAFGCSSENTEMSAEEATKNW